MHICHIPCTHTYDTWHTCCCSRSLVAQAPQTLFPFFVNPKYILPIWPSPPAYVYMMIKFKKSLHPFEHTRVHTSVHPATEFDVWMKKAWRWEAATHIAAQTEHAFRMISSHVLVRYMGISTAYIMLYVSKFACMNICMYVCIYIYIYIYICLRTRAYVRLYAHTHTLTQYRAFDVLCMCMFMCTCM